MFNLHKYESAVHVSHALREYLYECRVAYANEVKWIEMKWIEMCDRWCGDQRDEEDTRDCVTNTNVTAE